MSYDENVLIRLFISPRNFGMLSVVEAEVSKPIAIFSLSPRLDCKYELCQTCRLFGGYHRRFSPMHRVVKLAKYSFQLISPCLSLFIIVDIWAGRFPLVISTCYAADIDISLTLSTISSEIVGLKSSSNPTSPYLSVMFSASFSFSSKD